MELQLIFDDGMSGIYILRRILRFTFNATKTIFYATHCKEEKNKNFSSKDFVEDDKGRKDQNKNVNFSAIGKLGKIEIAFHLF